ncbi:hypothetical protein G6F21_014272 [Rhizopus arrhizus]|nr:hypothetical protein G6F21_014272 [Rhizopus arrhizus]
MTWSQPIFHSSRRRGEVRMALAKWRVRTTAHRSRQSAAVLPSARLWLSMTWLRSALMARRSARAVAGEYAGLKATATVGTARARASGLTALPAGEAMATS